VRWLDRFILGLRSGNELVLIALYVLIVAVCFMAVIFRYILNDSLTWAEEGARYLFIAMVFLGGAYVILEDGHLRMDVLYTSVPRAVRRAIDAVTVACALFFLGSSLAAIWAGLGIAGSQRWSSLPLPMQIAYLPMLIGVALGLLYLLHVAMCGRMAAGTSADGGPASSDVDER
jgi:TRAP-type C4-dicarboxylate transport system permease small subunit